MAQTGYTPILLYSSTTPSQAPAAGNLTNSTFGSELAINITDGKLFYKDNANAVQVIAWKTTPTTAGGTGLTSYTAGDLLYYATGSTLTKLAIGASTTILTSSGTAPQWSAASGVTVGTATNLAGGVAGSVPYQTAAGTTAMLAIGASGRWLGSSGTAPQWNAPAALTKTDDTNVTLTLGGSASTALLNAASLTLGWTGTLAVSRGGTGTGTAFTAGSVIFAGASGVYSQNNSGLFFDTATNKLGINTATVGSFLTVAGDGSFTLSNATGTTPLIVANDSTSGTVTAKLAFRNQGSTKCSINAAVFNNGYMDFSVNNDTFAQRIHASTGVSIGNTTDPGATNLSVTGTVSTAANLTFTGTGARIIGDFNSGTIANRTIFQTSGVNSGTVVSTIPNGTGTTGQFVVINNSTPTNAQLGQLLINTSEVRLASGAYGTGTSGYLPLTFYTGGGEKFRIDTSGNILIGGTLTPASATKSLALFNGVVPTGSVTDGCVLYTEDVSSSSELKVRDEAGNVTTLSPHNFSLIEDGPSEDMAWAYYSERNGKKINVDMLKLARMVEKLTGEKLVYQS